MSGALIAVFTSQRGFATVADAPGIGTAAATSTTTANVAFTAPANDGGAAITSYVATSTPGSITGTLSQSGSGTVAVTGLTASTSYTFTVHAVNSVGNSAESSASNSTSTTATTSQVDFTTAGTFSWVAVAGAFNVSALAIGGGATKGAGGLGYKNNYTTVPGNSYTVEVGSASNDSYFVSSGTVEGEGGAGGAGGGHTGDGGGDGGYGVPWNGGGAAGYSGTGGGAGGGGRPGNGGGGGSGGYDSYCATAGGGGGVGLLGEGSSGAGGTDCNNYPSPTCCNPGGGGGGSGGAAGAAGPNGAGGLYGGAGGNNGGTGAKGAVRILWPGSSRSYPSTNTGNL